MVHDILKNDLAAGVLPCGRFGANAAWLRLAVLAHNVMTALKRLALSPELLLARPKRLRFLIFNTAGRLMHHARQTVLRSAARRERLAEWIAALGVALGSGAELKEEALSMDWRGVFERAWSEKANYASHANLKRQARLPAACDTQESSPATPRRLPNAALTARGHVSPAPRAAIDGLGSRRSPLKSAVFTYHGCARTVFT